MELLTLNSEFQPANLIERYGSFIWTERYSVSGDFQLISNDIERMVNLLPLDSYVTIRESTVPMVVETHEIKKKPSEAPVLTVKGRSFETVLERRATAMLTRPRDLDTTDAAPNPKVAWVESAAKPSDAAYNAIRKILGDGARSTVTGPLDPQDPILSYKDAIPEVDLIAPADYARGAGSSFSFEIKTGNLYNVAMELINSNHHGLKAVRPDLNSNQIGIEIYNGADLSDTVMFDARFDQFDDSTYLLSRAGSYNMAYVLSKSDSQLVKKTQADEPSGLDRRVLVVDASSEENADTEDARKTRGLVELYKYNATALFDGHISEQLVTGFNRDYFLGDIIRLDGEYGLSQIVRVAEFIRSDDSTGSKAYPTFEVVS
jgi:hypothetical protein